MRMYFGNYSDDQAIKRWIKDEIERKEAYIADLRLKYEKWREGITFVEEISLDVGIASYSAQVETLKRKLEQLETKTIKQKNENKFTINKGWMNMEQSKGIKIVF